MVAHWNASSMHPRALGMAPSHERHLDPAEFKRK